MPNDRNALSQVLTASSSPSFGDTARMMFTRLRGTPVKCCGLAVIKSPIDVLPRLNNPFFFCFPNTTPPGPRNLPFLRTISFSFASGGTLLLAIDRSLKRLPPHLEGGKRKRPDRGRSE